MSASIITTTTTTATTSTTSPPPPSSSSPLQGTYHRRQLPCPSIAFASKQGRKLFSEALQEGYMNAYFSLAEHFHTQAYPTYCGLGSLSMTLNTLFVDPKRIWQGVWRWFDDSMLQSPESLEVIKQKGITMSTFASIATSNGCHVTMKYGHQITLEEFRHDIQSVCSQSPENFHEEEPTILEENAGEAAAAKKEGEQKNVPCSCSENSTSNDDDDDALKAPHHPAVVMVVSYARPVLNQTGDGHFSPIAGYHPNQDMVLIMDVARFKYPPHWVPVKVLYDALQPIDLDSGCSRGYFLLSATDDLYRNDIPAESGKQ